MKTHPKTVRFYRFGNLHAEMNAIIRAHDLDLTNATLACVRINRAGTLMNSRPCEECILAMKYYGIGCMVYSSRNGIGKEFLRENK